MSTTPDSCDPRFSYASATRNDFVMVDDPECALALEPQDVVALAGKTGAGTDGLIRAARTASLMGDADVQGDAEDLPEWFMDYRNADGSVAQMCGNGVRAFAAFLEDRGYVTDDRFSVMTRAGVRTVTVLEGGPEWQVRVGMGPVHLEGQRRRVRIAGRWLEAEDVNVGNPHTVVQLPEDLDLDGLDLSVKPELDPEPEEGTNIEFVRVLGERHVAMRVYERGVGETLSCGTGATAVAAATAKAVGEKSRREWTVEVRGGTLEIGYGEGSEMTLSGPATLEATLPSAPPQ